MKKIFATKLLQGDTIGIIAPSMSLSYINSQNRKIADERFNALGFRLNFGRHVEEIDEFDSSSIASRVEDLHAAFNNPEIKAIIAVIGGFNCNQLFRYIDWNLIQTNPKIFCGFSDTTGLENAIFTKTGLVTYSGPSYSFFSQEQYFDYSLEYFKKCLMSEDPYEILPSKSWSDDEWYNDQKNRTLIPNDGFFVINEGIAEGTLIGGNHSLLGLLQGTEYFPNLTNTVLFLEDDYEVHPKTFDANLQSLIHLPGFSGVKGIVIGRFQKTTNMTNALLEKIIKTKKELDHLPVITNVDFGHTDQMITFPVGGDVSIDISHSSSKITITKH